MHSSLLFVAALASLGSVSALPQLGPRQTENYPNPFESRQLFVNPKYSQALQQTRNYFLSISDVDNAGKVQYVQERVGSFVWISNVASLKDIDTAIDSARAAQKSTGQQNIVGLVLYDLPNRDCGAGESAGEFNIDDWGLDRYKNEYVSPFAAKVLAASDLQFAIVVEPDAIGNMVTGQGIESCARAAEPQRDGIAYAIQKLQAGHVHLYIDASNGGWLGTSDHIKTMTGIFASIVQKAGSWARIRGFATNVSNYNPVYANPRESFTEGSTSYDENNYVLSLVPAFEAAGLPTRFIIDQGRVANPGARKAWGEWCNVSAGFGQPATTRTGNAHVDSIVWVKPGGESDGQCGLEGAPVAGAWFEGYARMLAINAHSEIKTPVQAAASVSKCSSV